MSNKGSKGVVRWTFDIESDFGGRSQNTLGLKYGLPKILKLLKEYKKKGLFFISTELLSGNREILSKILDEGHDVGSHGHFHIVWKDFWRAEEDRKISNEYLKNFDARLYHREFEYRAPKFSHRTSSEYSDPKGHIGLLKQTWFGGELPKDFIFYMHPFDIVSDKDAPDLFCRVWYSNPGLAYKTLLSILAKN